MEVRGALQGLSENASRVGAVIHRYRTFLQRRKFSLRNIGLNKLVVDTVALSQYETNHREVSVKLNLWPERLIARAGKIELQQVLINLFLNSCDAMRNTVHTALTGFVELIVAVQDITGPDWTNRPRGGCLTSFTSPRPEALGSGLP
jgi:C4-dicarboxylate-specific signal transduction histidine kinase